jgi:hypothetical protein
MPEPAPPSRPVVIHDVNGAVLPQEVLICMTRDTSPVERNMPYAGHTFSLRYKKVDGLSKHPSMHLTAIHMAEVGATGSLRDWLLAVDTIQIQE